MLSEQWSDGSTSHAFSTLVFDCDNTMNYPSLGIFRSIKIPCSFTLILK